VEVDRVPTPDKPARRPPWNKGKLVGAKPPLRPSHYLGIEVDDAIEIAEKIDI
jgi:hypothetical protein